MDSSRDIIRSAVRRMVTGVVTDLSDVTEAARHTDDELLDLAISAAGEYAALADRTGVYERVLDELDVAGCDRRRAYHILARLASEVDSMLERNDAERDDPGQPDASACEV
jgi:RES domain-containing protein